MVFSRFAPLVVVATIGGLGVGGASAAPDPTVRALLAEPTELAAWLAERDPMVDSARAHIEAARATSSQARVLPNPSLSVEASDFVLGKTTTGDDGQDAHLTLGQTTIFTFGISQLFELGKRGPRHEAAELRVGEASEAAIATLGSRLGDATLALGKLAYVAAKRDVVAANLTAAKQLRDLEKIRLDNKDLSAVEFARIELDTEELDLQLGRAEAELAGTTAACNATIYIACSAIGLEASLLDRAAALPDQLPDPDAAISTRPVRRASELETRALGWDATLASHRKIPDVTLGVGYTLDNLVVSGDQHQSVAFTIGFPLPIFDRGNHDAAAARANARAIHSEDRAAVREARGLVDSLLAQRGALATTLHRLETEAVPKSTQIIVQTRKAFDLGQARLADLLLVERAHRDLLLEVLETRFDLFNVRAQLRQTLGFDDEVARTAMRSHR